MKKEMERSGIFLLGLAFIIWTGGWLIGCATDMSVSHTLSAKSFTEGGQHDEAIKQARQSIESNPNYAPGWYWLGVAQFRKGRYDEAITAFKKVAELRPIGEQWPSSHSFLGWSYYWKRNHDEALNYFNRTLQINPQYHESVRGRGWTYYRQRNYDLAIQDFSRAIGIKKDDQDSLLGRSWSHVEKGELEGAIADTNKILELDPKNALALRSRGWCYSRMKDYDRAIESCDRSLELNHNDPEAYWGRGFAHFYQGRYQEAIKDFNQVSEKLDPKTLDRQFIWQDSLRGKSYAYLFAFKRESHEE